MPVMTGDFFFCGCVWFLLSCATGCPSRELLHSSIHLSNTTTSLVTATHELLLLTQKKEMHGITSMLQECGQWSHTAVIFWRHGPNLFMPACHDDLQRDLDFRVWLRTANLLGVGLSYRLKREILRVRRRPPPTTRREI